MNLTTFDAHFKCRAHAGAQTCRYLLAAQRPKRGFVCAYVDKALRDRIDARFLRGHTAAKAGPCANPHDSHTEAAMPAFLSRN